MKKENLPRKTSRARQALPTDEYLEAVGDWQAIPTETACLYWSRYYKKISSKTQNSHLLELWLEEAKYPIKLLRSTRMDLSYFVHLTVVNK
jgi:hypothetical protein